MIKIALYVIVVCYLINLFIGITFFYSVIKNRKILKDIWKKKAIKMNGLSKTCFITMMLYLSTIKLVNFNIVEN